MCAVREMRLRPLVHLGGDDDMRQVGRGLDVLDDPEFDIMVLDLSLAGLQAGSRFEGDGDHRAFFGQGGVGEPGRNEKRDDRQNPDRREAPTADLRRFRRQFRLFGPCMRKRIPLGHRFSPAASHISRGSNAAAANMVMMTTAAKDTAPTPGLMVAIEPNWTRPARIESMKMSIIDQRPIDSTIL